MEGCVVPCDRSFLTTSIARGSPLSRGTCTPYLGYRPGWHRARLGCGDFCGDLPAGLPPKGRPGAVSPLILRVRAVSLHPAAGSLTA